MPESNRQRRKLAPLGHVRTSAEVVIVVALDGIQDLAVQDERRPVSELQHTSAGMSDLSCLVGTGAQPRCFQQAGFCMRF